jgi:hypothetical protein
MQPDILKDILNYKAEYIEHVKRKTSLHDQKHRATDSEATRGFTDHLLSTISEADQVLLLK